jgi:hypothetical protein
VLIIARLLSNLDRLKEVRKKNARLREALSFYADDKSYEDMDYESPEGSHVLSDLGRKAKSALEASK